MATKTHENASTNLFSLQQLLNWGYNTSGPSSNCWTGGITRLVMFHSCVHGSPCSANIYDVESQVTVTGSVLAGDECMGIFSTVHGAMR